MTDTTKSCICHEHRIECDCWRETTTTPALSWRGVRRALTDAALFATMLAITLAGVAALLLVGQDPAGW